MIQHLSVAEKTFLKKFASVIRLPNNKTYYYMPLWFYEDEHGGFESLSFDSLPDELKAHIRNMRDGKTLKSNATSSRRDDGVL